MKSKLETQLWDFMTELDEFWQDYLLNLFTQRILRPDMTLKDSMEVMDGLDDHSIDVFEQFLENIAAPRQELGKPVVINLNTEPPKKSEKRDLVVFKGQDTSKGYDDIGIPMNDLKRLCTPEELEELEYILARLFAGWFTDIGTIQRKLWTLTHGESMISSQNHVASMAGQSNSKKHAVTSLGLLNSILAKMKKPS